MILNINKTLALESSFKKIINPHVHFPYIQNTVIKIIPIIFPKQKLSILTDTPRFSLSLHYLVFLNKII
jgi:hypothetical protein